MARVAATPGDKDKDKDRDREAGGGRQSHSQAPAKEREVVLPGLSEAEVRRAMRDESNRLVFGLENRCAHTDQHSYYICIYI
jgi:hypothetical protein